MGYCALLISRAALAVCVIEDSVRFYDGSLGTLAIEGVLNCAALPSRGMARH